MKSKWLKIIGLGALATFLFACGQKIIYVSHVALRPGSVIWQGKLNERPDFLQVWNDTLTCIYNNYAGPYYTDFPTVIETNQSFIYNGKAEVAACDIEPHPGTIYLWATPDEGNELDYLTHEIIHIVTRLDDSAHPGTDPSKWLPVFRVCGIDNTYSGNGGI